MVDQSISGYTDKIPKGQCIKMSTQAGLPQVTYILKSANLCGGVKVVLEQAAELHKRGRDVMVYYVMESPAWFDKPVPCEHYGNMASLTSALQTKRHGIKVATWFETAFWLKSSLTPEDRGYYLVQDIEDSYCVTPHAKEVAISTYKLGLKPITTSKWVKKQLQDRFSQNATLVSLGVDFNKFYRIPDLKVEQRDRFRILTQSRVWSAGPNLKGWPTAAAVIQAAFEIDRGISLVTFSVEKKQYLRQDLPHIHIESPDDIWLNRLYNESGLYLLTSNHEGFGLTAAEAMACGCPVVATYADGNEEFCINGRTALMADKQNYDKLRDHVLYLFHNPDYADSLAIQAYDFIKQYTWKASIDALENEFYGTKHDLPYNLTSENIAAPPLAVVGEAVDSLEYPDVEWKVTPEPNVPDVLVVIPTVNSYELPIRAAISALRSDPRITSQVVIVDDGTKDKAIIKQLQDSVSDNGPISIKCVKSNLGFSNAINTGLRDHSNKYALLCNNDVVLASGCIGEMVEVFESRPEVGIVGAKLLYENGTIQHAGMEKVSGGLYFHHRFRGCESSHPPANISCSVWSVTGAVFMIRSELLRQIGGLSTAYATAWEDVDYCVNAWRQGWHVWYCAEAVAVHQEGATRGYDTNTKMQKPLMWMEREASGERYFLRKWKAIADFQQPEQLLK